MGLHSSLPLEAENLLLPTSRAFLALLELKLTVKRLIKWLQNWLERTLKNLSLKEQLNLVPCPQEVAVELLAQQMLLLLPLRRLRNLSQRRKKRMMTWDLVSS